VGQRILPAYYRDQTQGLMITHNHINSQRSSTGLQHFNRLGMAGATDKSFALLFRDQLIWLSAAAVASSSKEHWQFPSLSGQ